MRTTPNIPEPVREALTEVLDYLWDAEKEDFENEPRDGHIFHSLRALCDWLKDETS